MAILFITHKFPPFIGGMEKQSYELITGASKRINTYAHTYEGKGSKVLWFLRLKKEIKAKLAAHPDITAIHLNDCLLAAFALWLKKLTTIPVFVTVHGLDLTFPLGIYQKYIVPKIAKFDGFICVSENTRKFCLQRGFSPEKCTVVRNGVDHDLSDMPKDAAVLENLLRERGLSAKGKKVIVTMGRPVKRKGFSWFLKNVVPKLPQDILFVMIGPFKPEQKKKWLPLPKKWQRNIDLMFGKPSDTAAVASLLSLKAYQGRAVHLGKLSFLDLMTVLASGELFVMPNVAVEGDAEGFGLVALEASLRGLPLLVAGIEGITDAVHHHGNGWHLLSKDAKAWTDRIKELLHDSDELEKMKKNGPIYTKNNFSWDKMTKENLAFMLARSQAKDKTF